MNERRRSEVSVRLEFTDCLGCGKRVATTAPVCRHCNTRRTPSKIATSTASALGSKDIDQESQDEDADSHASLGLGGYGQDDFDDAIELDKSSSERKTLYWYVALVLLIVFSIGALFPWFY